MKNLVEHYIEIVNARSHAIVMPDSEFEFYIPKHVQLYGYYKNDLDIIFVNPELKQDQSRYLQVMFHELAHASGHPKRLNRIAIKSLKFYLNSEYIRAVEELIAERASELILKALNIKYDEFITYRYMFKFKTQLKQSGHWNLALEAHIETQSKKAAEYVLNTWICSLDASQLEAREVEKMKEFMKFF